MYGITDAIPFSCFHAYQRSDSVWVNQYTTPAEAFAEGFASKRVRLLPAFISYDCVTDEYRELRPKPIEPNAIDPLVFGDDWSEQLSTSEAVEVAAYFTRIEALRGRIDAIIFRVGKKDVSIDIPILKHPTKRQIVFEAPRASLMSAIRNEVFDDLLGGNFIKTTLTGKWPASRLYPFFAPVVGKYADNGRAFTIEDVDAYFHHYRSRDPFDFIVHRLHEQSIQSFRNFISPESPVFDFGKRAYFFVKKFV
jgi:hypothetical protein